jgi:ribosome biogenesis GTPase / thiamine phosphate phosphatase
VIAGPSGVGKSSLLNAVQPGLGLRVGALSDGDPQGAAHHGRRALIPLECGGYVADTPGLRELGLWGIDADELADCFPEFTQHRTCRFSRSCSHTHEPGCGVREAVEAGQVDRERYDSYRLLHEEAIAAPS